ncbi:DUF983 domain-containing protein [Palleronia sp. LCG004]|uniref:DUF983 domain-containing protein n=1 Tax=Palleronia sp. LCG004 TaxID=3079304 RepID=UPI00294318F0|nr:DUF983 domain-containing protein [Palleronia sp. LCG004]WOI55053.1 DUF983 domain-containing protein [Palleronia sp. LCG004]
MFDDTANDAETHDRALKPAVLRGFRCKCPNCGSGPLLSGYLKPRPACTVCGEDLRYARADDAPAYLTILLVGHLMAPFMHWGFVRFRPEPIVLAAIFITGCVALSLYLLPRIKGMVIGFQWARRMHGF